MRENDEDLVRRTLEGDERAFARLLRIHFRTAFVIASSYCRNDADAEDVCQRAFVKAHTKLDQCRDPARFGTWLASIVVNESRSWLVHARYRQTEPLDAIGFDPPSGSASPATEHERSASRERLNRALSQLSQVQRDIVLLHDLEGWRHADIAEALGVSDLMSRRHLSDARKKLRAILGGRDDD